MGRTSALEPARCGLSSPGGCQRLDVRIEKDRAFFRGKLAVYGEVLNLTNHYNPRYVYSSNTTVVTGQGRPVLHMEGVALKF